MSNNNQRKNTLKCTYEPNRVQNTQYTCIILYQTTFIYQQLQGPCIKCLIPVKKNRNFHLIFISKKKIFNSYLYN